MNMVYIFVFVDRPTIVEADAKRAGQDPHAHIMDTTNAKCMQVTGGLAWAKICYLKHPPTLVQWS